MWIVKKYIPIIYALCPQFGKKLRAKDPSYFELDTVKRAAK